MTAAKIRRDDTEPPTAPGHHPGAADFAGGRHLRDFLFPKLGGAIDVILRENYNSVVASQNMKDAAERMDAGLLLDAQR